MLVARYIQQALLFFSWMIFSCILMLVWAWPDPLPIRYAGKGLRTNVGFSRVGYSEEGVGLIKTKQPQSSASKSSRSKANCFRSRNGKDCGSDLKVKGGL